jgi:hypothetical protein
MARREQYFTIRAEPQRDDNGNVVGPAKPGRDEGKTFYLREMDADRAEEWGIRAFLALTNAGAELPDGFEGSGMAGIAAMGFQALAGLKFDDVKPLWDDMFTCVQCCPDARVRETIRPLIKDDIEEVSTRLLLRRAIFELHVGFSLPGVQSTSAPETPFPDGGVITRTLPVQ